MEAGRRLAGLAFHDRVALGRREDQSRPVGEDGRPPLAYRDHRRERGWLQHEVRSFWMASWKFWDWVAYACLFVAAVIVAADAAIKNAPTLSPHLPDWIGREYWSFAPLAMLTLGGIIFLVKVIRVRLPGARI